MFNKKRIIALLLIFALVVPLLPRIIFSEEFNYTAVSGGGEIIKNATFTDIKNSISADNIMKMAAYSVVREYGAKTFRPNTAVSRAEALSMIVRVIGKQDQAMQQSDRIKVQQPKLGSIDAYLRGHVETAITLGIITRQEFDKLSTLAKAEKTAVEAAVAKTVKSNWKMTLAEKEKLLKDSLTQKSFEKGMKSQASRKELAIWLYRALALKPIKGEKTMQVYNYKDWKEIGSTDVPFVEAVLRKEIMKGASFNTFSPGKGVTRGEAAAIMNNIIEAELDGLGLKRGFGKIESIKSTKNTSTVAQKSETSIRIEAPNGDIINVTVDTATNAKSGRLAELPVIKNNAIGSEKLLAKGDVVEFTINDENQVLLLHVGKYREISGTFRGYNQKQEQVQIRDKNGKNFNLKVMPDSIIQVENNPINAKDIPLNTPVKAIYSGDALKAMEVGLPADVFINQEIIAKILFADPVGKVIKFLDESGNQRYVNVDDNTKFYINGDRQGIESVGFDQDAVLKLAQSRLIEAKIFTDILEDEEENTQKVLMAKVREVVGNNLIVSAFDEPNKQIGYIVDSNSVIIKDRKLVDKSKIKQGDNVKLYVDSLNDKYPYRVEVQGVGVALEGIYRGEIRDVLLHTGEIVLSNIHSYGHYDWIKKDDYMKFQLSDDISIYNGNTKLDKNKLKDNLGKTIYAAARKNFGEVELVQAVLKEGNEDLYYRTIKDIKFTDSQLKLSDDRLVHYRQGSIVVKGGRLLDTFDLSKNSEAFIIQNKTNDGTNIAPIISLDSFNAFASLNISKGYLIGMGEDYYTLEKGYSLVNNKWSLKGDLLYQMSRDTNIYDNVVEKGVITSTKLAESRYRPYTYTWPGYNPAIDKDVHENDKFHKDYAGLKNDPRYHEHNLVYVITDDYGFSKAVNIYKKDKEAHNPSRTHMERMAAGQIESINSETGIIRLKNAREYSGVYNAWRPVTATLTIDYSKAVALQDDRIIPSNNLKPGDDIYMLINDGYGIFIFME